MKFQPLSIPKSKIDVMGKIKLSGIYVYPIKSIAGVSINESIVGERGLKHDRRWMLIDEQNQFITQRKYHEMALIDLKLKDEYMILNHRIKRIGQTEIPLEISEGEQILSTIWSDHVKVIWPKLIADEWISGALQTSCRLVYMPDNSKRQIDPAYVSTEMNTSLSDGYPFLLANNKSLEDVCEKTGVKLEMKRFRPNLVIHTKAAFEEDRWAKLSIGKVNFEIVKPCARCVMTTIDPETGKAGEEPMKTLATYRKQNGRIIFGQNMIAGSEGSIHIGDEIISFDS